MDFNFNVITEDAFNANLLKDFSNISFRTKKSNDRHVPQDCSYLLVFQPEESLRRLVKIHTEIRGDIHCQIV